MGQKIDPVNATLEQGTAASDSRVAPPATRPLVFDGVEMDEADLTEHTGPDNGVQLPGERLVAVVLRDQHAAAAPGFRTADLRKVPRIEKRRFLDDDMFSVLQR